MKLTATITLIAVFISFITCGQTSNRRTDQSYQIDSGLTDKIEKKVKSFNDVSMGSIDFRIYQNDSLVGETYSMAKSMESVTMSELNGDTAYITGFLGMFAGLGFQITLFKDTCIIRHLAKSDVEIYKLNKSDSPGFGVFVPCRTYNLKLISKPAFKKGEIIEGLIELSSEDYYEVSNGEDSKYRIELTGYFKTQPLASLNDQLNKYEKKK